MEVNCITLHIIELIFLTGFFQLLLISDSIDILHTEDLSVGITTELERQIDEYCPLVLLTKYDRHFLHKNYCGFKYPN